MTWAGDITEIIWKRGLPSAARAFPASGRVEIDPDQVAHLNEGQIAFIIEHERAHLLLQTRNEFEADEAALHLAHRRGIKLRDCVRALCRALDMSNPEHLERIERLYHSALRLDREIMNTENNMLLEYSLGGTSVPEDGNEAMNAGGRERRQRRRELKDERLEAKNDIKAAKAENIRAGGKSGLSGVLESAGEYAGKVAGAVQKVMGGGGSVAGDPAAGAGGGLPAPAGMSSGLKWGLIGGGLLLVALVLFLVFRKKGKGK